jgi:hypothetical protein
MSVSLFIKCFTLQLSVAVLKEINNCGLWTLRVQVDSYVVVIFRNANKHIKYALFEKLSSQEPLLRAYI